MTVITFVQDGMKNLVSRLGTDSDKRTATTYTDARLDSSTLRNMYRSTWLAKKIVDIPAQDATRQWRNWQAKPDHISAIEAIEKRLKIRKKVKEAQRRARLYGGSAMLIGVDADLKGVSEPLDPESVGADDLRFLTVLSRSHLSAYDPVLTPDSEYFMKPEHYDLNGMNGVNVKIHASRLVLFTGVEVDEDSMIGSDGFGDSVLQCVYQTCRDADASVANVAALMFEAKTDSIGIPGLTEMLAADPKNEQRIIDRLSLSEKAKSIIGSTVHDTEEEIGRKTIAFTGIPDVLDKFFMVVAGAADIPMTRFFGNSPGGLNSTGEGDLRNYYDLIKDLQETSIQDPMTILDECLIRSALGDRPEEIFYEWAPLWQISAPDRAKIGESIAKTAKDLETMVNPEALARGATNALIELGAMPGLEMAINEVGLAPEEPTEEELAALTGQPTEVTDAAPRTLYVSRPVVNAAEIRKWAKAQGFESIVEDLHVTIAFSRAPVDWMRAGEPWSEQVEIPAGGPRLMDQFGDAKVLLFSSSMVNWRHEEIERIGGSWDHEEFQPHVTITYGETPADVDPYTGPIVLGPEVFAEVKDDARSRIVES